MKILLVTHRFPPDHFRGTEVYTFELAQELIAQGHKVLVAAVRELKEPAGLSLVRDSYGGVPVARLCKHLRPENFEDYFFDPEMDRMFEDLARDFAPDLIHETYFLGGLSLGISQAALKQHKLFVTVTDFSALCARGQMLDRDLNPCPGPRDGVRCVYCLFDKRWIFADPKLDRWAREHLPLAIGGLKKSPEREMVRKRNRAVQDILEKARRVIFAHPLTLEVFRKNGVQLNNPALLDFGVNTKLFGDHKKTSTNRLRIGFIGQILPHKGLDLLVDALAGVADQEKLELFIYGSLADPAEKAYFDSLNLGRVKHQRWLGTFDYSQMNQVLQGIDLLVMPSRWQENCPLVPKYALLTGTWLLLSDAPGILVKADDPGIDIFANGNVAGLWAKIEEMVKTGKWKARLEPRQDLVLSIQDHAQALLRIYSEQA